MKTTQILKLVLTVFVLASVVAIIFSETKSAPNLSQTPTPVSEEKIATPDHQVIAYYFHGSARCTNCRSFEAYTEEALKGGFGEALKDGLLVWKVVNLEEKGNEHFVTDYQLHTKSVVLSDVQNGHETQWKNLDKIWDLVKNKDDFITYIQQETAMLMGKSNG